MPLFIVDHHTSQSDFYEVEEKNGNPDFNSKEELENLVDQASSLLLSDENASIYVLERGTKRALNQDEKKLLQEVMTQKFKKKDQEAYPKFALALSYSFLEHSRADIAVGIPTVNINGKPIEDTPGTLKVAENLNGGQLDFKYFFAGMGSDSIYLQGGIGFSAALFGGTHFAQLKSEDPSVPVNYDWSGTLIRLDVKPTLSGRLWLVHYFFLQPSFSMGVSYLTIHSGKPVVEGEPYMDYDKDSPSNTSFVMNLNAVVGVRLGSSPIVLQAGAGLDVGPNLHAADLKIGTELTNNMSSKVNILAGLSSLF